MKLINLQGNLEKRIAWWANAILSEPKGAALLTLKFIDGVFSPMFHLNIILSSPSHMLSPL